MANYPTSLDNFTNPTAVDSLNTPSHSLQHADANDAIEALEAKLGIGASPAGSATSGYVLTAGTGGTTTWAAAPASGLVPIVPTSITKGASGSASVSTNGLVTFSGTEFVRMNGIFSSTYTNYRIIINASNSSTVNFRARLSSGGTENSSANYRNEHFLAYGTTLAAIQSLGITYWDLIDIQTGTKNWCVFEISNPYQTEHTMGNMDTIYAGNATIQMRKIVAGIDVTTSYDGISFYGASGTMSGTFKVFGYRND